MKKHILQIKLIGTIVALFIIIVTAGVVSYSKDDTRTTDSKYITQFEVRYGDTLWTIAEQYITDEYRSIKDYVKEIKLTNNLKDNTIYPNQYLVIPYYQKSN